MVRHRLTRTKPRRLRGITLVELLVTLSIVVILLTIGVPAFTELMARNRMTAAINSLLADLQLARSEAIKRGEAVQLCTSLDQATCNGDTNWHKGYIIHQDGTVLRVGGNDAQSGLRITTSNRRLFTFQPDGTSGGSTITWKFCDPADRTDARAVIVSNVGRPRTSSTDSSGHDLSCP